MPTFNISETSRPNIFKLTQEVQSYLRLRPSSAHYLTRISLYLKWSLQPQRRGWLSQMDPYLQRYTNTFQLLALVFKSKMTDYAVCILWSICTKCRCGRLASYQCASKIEPHTAPGPDCFIAIIPGPHMQLCLLYQGNSPFAYSKYFIE